MPLIQLWRCRSLRHLLASEGVDGLFLNKAEQLKIGKALSKAARIF